MSSTRIQCAIAFFDRDGTLIEDMEYKFETKQLQWISGAVEAVRVLNSLNWKVGVVTNQSAVARGLCSESDVNEFHEYMNDRLAIEGAKIDFFEFCPYHPDAVDKNYKASNHFDRKPNPGMIVRALQREQADISRSFLIGDRESDLLAASAAGIDGHLFLKGMSLQELVLKAISTDRQIKRDDRDG